MLVVPYGAVAGILAQRSEQLADTVVVDISDPVDFETLDSLLVPADGCAAAEIAARLPRSRVLKASTPHSPRAWRPAPSAGSPRPC